MIIGQIVGGEKLDLDLPTLVDTRLPNPGQFRRRQVVAAAAHC